MAARLPSSAGEQYARHAIVTMEVPSDETQRSFDEFNISFTATALQTLRPFGSDWGLLPVSTAAQAWWPCMNVFARQGAIGSKGGVGVPSLDEGAYPHEPSVRYRGARQSAACDG
jgi:hypothetical protein